MPNGPMLQAKGQKALLNVPRLVLRHDGLVVRLQRGLLPLAIYMYADGYIQLCIRIRVYLHTDLCMCKSVHTYVHRFIR